VPTLFVAGTNDWPSLPGGAMPCLPLIDWATLGRLAEEGVSLGAHSRSHPDLRALGPAELQDEIQGSSDDIRRQTGVDPDAFAYPYGRWSPGVVSAVRSAFSRACTTVLRPLRRGEDPHLLPRLDVFYLSGPGRLERFGRGSFGGYLRARAFLRDLGQRARARLST
jgi:peptidoglycan/xylan/chitin deacetylase (PgdA/CDA1 family)